MSMLEKTLRQILEDVDWRQERSRDLSKDHIAGRYKGKRLIYYNTGFKAREKTQDSRSKGVSSRIAIP